MFDCAREKQTSAERKIHKKGETTMAWQQLFPLSFQPILEFHIFETQNLSPLWVRT